MSQTDRAEADARADELAAHRLLAQALCHQAKNFLAIAEMCGEVGLSAADPEKTLGALRRVRDSARPLAERVERFHRLSAGEALPRLPGGGCDLAQACAVALDLGAHALERSRVSVARDLRPAPIAAAPQSGLSLALLLLLSVVEISSRGGATIDLTTARDATHATLTLSYEGEVGDIGGALERRLSGAREGGSRERDLLALAGASAVAKEAGGVLALSRTPDGFAVRATFPGAP